MHALIVVAHPELSSLTHAVAAELAQGISAADPQNSFEVADLAAEGFDPRQTAADLAYFRNQGPVPAEVAAEQARIDRADALVLVYPVYWWSFPGLLKGWIDRVFTNGWAYDHEERGIWQRLPVHLVALGASSRKTYAKRGYDTAMKTQIEHGIFDYCGARVASASLLSQSDEGFAQSHFDEARRIGAALFAAETTTTQ
ncbi:MAG: NAD(P)H-dependent oxidoreductase [Comamonas sp.]|jgi:NAD(P)H dehydrogenase (quinone)|nr:NAD(P)H-dependent oxidoreductase [Comamonas sp.]